MYSRDQEQKRKRDLFENISIMHMLSLFIMLFAFVLSQDFFAEQILPITNFGVLIFFVICLTLFALINVFNKKYYDNIQENRLSWLTISYAGYPLLIIGFSLLFGHDSIFITPVVFFLPVIIAASMGGQVYGFAMATVCTLILFFFNFIRQDMSIYIFIESNLIFVGVIYIVGWFIGAQMDSERETRKYLTHLANTDMLTGLYNHRYYQDKLREYVDKADTQSPLALVLLDINYFKHYNDSFGHMAGDKVLRTVSKVLKSQDLGQNSFAARYAGGQFVMVLSNCNGSKAVAITESIISKINQYEFAGEQYQPEGKIMISSGIAVYPDHAHSSRELQQFADQALYKARSLKRHRVELYFYVLDNNEANSNERELLNSIHTLISVINAKDRYTYGHSERVTFYAHEVAVQMQLSEQEIKLLDFSAFLHDIGKIEIDRELLNKHGKLNNEEWNIIRQHPVWGSDIIKPLEKLRPAVPIILYHHENYDGSGYPEGLAGDSIPMLARIIRVVDSFDAMTSYRPYKHNMSNDEALAELRQNAGTMFDPFIVQCFEKVIRDEESAAAEISQNA